MLIDQHREDAELTEELPLRMKDLVPLVNDPICGMRISPKTAAATLKIKGKRIYFCASGCKLEFKKRMKKKLRKL